MNKKINITSILNNATSLTDIFLYYERYFPNVPFLFKKSENKWKGQNFKKTGINVRKIFNFFKDLGLRKGDRVFLLSSNRVEWVEFDLAIIFIENGLVTPISEDNSWI